MRVHPTFARLSPTLREEHSSTSPDLFSPWEKRIRISKFFSLRAY